MADNTSQVAGLFMTPELYQQQQDQQALAQAAKLAEMTGRQRADLGWIGAGQQVARGLAGALGVQDPMMQVLSARQSIAKQINWNDPSSLAEASRQLLAMNDIQGSQELAAKAQLVNEKILGMAKTTSEIARNTREQFTTDQRNYAAAVEGGYKGTFQNWLEHQKLLGRNVANIYMPAAEKAFDVKLAELDAKTVDDARKMRDTSISAIKSLNELATLPAKDLITGQFAAGRVGATNLLSTLGLASQADVNKLSKSQQYQKVAGDVILQTLGGKLGSGFSNADREFIASLVPQLETSPDARRQLIQFMQAKNQDIVNETLRLEKYAREKKGLSGFDYKIPMSVTPSGSTSAASQMTDAQLKAIAGIK